MGAWIETRHEHSTKRTRMSHPMWVRGLKLTYSDVSVPRVSSHPMWVRGLKLTSWQKKAEKFVAPYVGAWIET